MHTDDCVSARKDGNFRVMAHKSTTAINYRSNTMLLNNLRYHDDWNASKLPQLVLNDEKLSLPVHSLPRHETKGVGVAPLVRQWLDERTICRLVSHLDHGAFCSMFGNIP